MTLTDVQSTDPNAQGYREFSLGAFHFARDEYFVHITWPTGKHVLSADVFLRALQRDVAWDFFYGTVNFDSVFGTVNHYGTVDMFAGRFNDAYRKAELDHTENFETGLIRDTFKAMLDDWTNASFDPFASPAETDKPFGIKDGSNTEAVDPPPRRREPDGQHSRATSRSAPTKPIRSTGCSPTCRRISPRCTPSPASRTRSPRTTCTPTSAAAMSRGTPASVSVCKASLYCPTSEEYMLPVFHGNDRVEWFVQLSDEIVWDVQDRDTGATAQQGHDEGRRRRGDARRHPPPGLQPEALDAAGVGERFARAAGDDPHGQGERVSRRLLMQNKLFIGGEFVDALGGGTIEVINPHDGSVITEIAEARADDVDRAVEAASSAFPAWRKMAAAERGRLLLKLADAIEANGEELAQLESLDTGHPISDARKLDVPRTAACFRYFGGMADKLQGDVIPVEPGFLNYVQREPLGVVGQIVPWNFPLMFCSWKMGPALAAGNTVVLKPSELTPLSSLRLAELMVDVGFPAGVVNMVPGFGVAAGERLANASRRRQDRVHRIDGDRKANRRVLGIEPQARAAGAGRQGRQHRLRRRDHSGSSRWQRVRHLPQPGSGVHRRLAAAAAREDRRRVSRAVHRAGEVDQGRQSAGSGDRDGPADVGDASRSRAQLREGRASTRAARSSPAARRPTILRSRTAATSSRPWCAPSRATGCAARRCSARSSRSRRSPTTTR